MTWTSCNDGLLVTPESPQFEGCPVLGKLRVVVVTGGVAAQVSWELRDASGTPIDLSSCLSSSNLSLSLSQSLGSGEGSVVVRIGNCSGAGEITQLTATIADPASGVVQFTLPTSVTGRPGLRTIAIGVLNAAGDPVFVETGMLSIERSLFADENYRAGGPPSIGEIRMHLRDNALQNTLLGEVEYSSDEILLAIRRPVAYWNEIPPPLTRYTCDSFPYRGHWLDGIVAELMLTASHHYMRNDMRIQHGGLQGNFKDKHRTYLELAAHYQRRWEDFVAAKKTEINMRGWMGSME